MEELNTVRRVTFKEAPSPSPTSWVGWENPFQDGSDLRLEAEEMLSVWRQGGTFYQLDHTDLDEPQDEPVTEADIKPRQNKKKEEKSSKLYKKFLKWKEKVRLVQNFFKVP